MKRLGFKHFQCTELHKRADFNLWFRGAWHCFSPEYYFFTTVMLITQDVNLNIVFQQNNSFQLTPWVAVLILRMICYEWLSVDVASPLLKDNSIKMKKKQTFSSTIATFKVDTSVPHLPLYKSSHWFPECTLHHSNIEKILSHCNSADYKSLEGHIH